jgi:riboflavin synthase
VFTGIIETIGKVISLKKEKGNLHITVRSTISDKLKIDQSLAHDGVCLTVVKLDKKKKTHTVVAVQETLKCTNLGSLHKGSEVNLERCLKPGGRLDGHMVLGHADTTAICKKIRDLEGSRLITVEYDEAPGFLTVEKGSVCLNGISLTVFNTGKNFFSVSIIPYTLGHTTLKSIKTGDRVNLEFDIIGKYVAKNSIPWKSAS